MDNHLKNQTSPYLLQHARNPVDWYPWGKEAFEKAEKEDKPIFLSIGYSTCHWCHVMAHESFENQEIADILNKYFVSVKVDREERPDIDSVYMSVCQTLTGSGGWPMSIFMTSRQEPFFAGTYFPPASNYSGIGFSDLLLAIAEKWKNNKSELLASANQIISHIKPDNRKSDEQIDDRLLSLAVEMFSQTYDEKCGGFGNAPKFPTPHNLIFLTLYSRIYHRKAPLQQVKFTLEQMRRGGIFDHIGYGFSRYSTDRYYLVPHFEKMLYDNALLIMAYCWGYKASGDKRFLQTSIQTAEYVFREMTGNAGEFYSAQDADSEGEEGKFYVWDYEEICKILGSEKGKPFCRHFGVTEQGNFEGRNIPNLLNENEISDAFENERKILYDYRKTRTNLHLDDKILTAWNSLMICALSLLYRTTGEKCYLSAAKRAQQFLEESLVDGNMLYVSCRGNTRLVKGFLDDYAYYTWALICLYEVTVETAYLERAQQICKEARNQFADGDRGYFLYGTQNESLIARPKETYDGALPSGNSVMAYCLVRLSQLTQVEEYRQAALKQLAFLSGEAKHYPAGYSMFLTALLMFYHQPQKITVVLSGEDTAGKVLASLPLYADITILEHATKEYKLLTDKTTYYVCADNTCLPPTNHPPFNEES